jgi:hypothetical protein
MKLLKRILKNLVKKKVKREKNLKDVCAVLKSYVQANVLHVF